MAKTTVWKEVEFDVEISLDDFEDSELIEELEARGYYIDKEPEMVSVEYYWNRGDKKEALIRLEREFPELIGISKIVN